MVNCKFCKNEIKKDRYSIYLVLERQDFPPSGRWSKNTERTLENVCPDCEIRLVNSYDQIIFAMERSSK